MADSHVDPYCPEHGDRPTTYTGCSCEARAALDAAHFAEAYGDERTAAKWREIAHNTVVPPERTDAAHPMMTHRDGQQCIWIAGTGWFVPLDVGGEGYLCENPEHAEILKAELSARGVPTSFWPQDEDWFKEQGA